MDSGIELDRPRDSVPANASRSDFRRWCRGLDELEICAATLCDETLRWGRSSGGSGYAVSGVREEGGAPMALGARRQPQQAKWPSAVRVCACVRFGKAREQLFTSNG